MSSNSPCAACKCLRRKCPQECVFAPYFPPDQPKKFEVVHKVFGASNVTKLLNELNTSQREDAVNSLAYEAEARLRDPIYGCVGHISLLQGRLKQAQADLMSAKKELAGYIGPQAMMALLPAAAPPGFIIQQPMMAMPPLSHGGMVQQQQPQAAAANHHQQQQIYEAHQLAAVAAREQEIEMLRSLEIQQRQGEEEMLRFNGGGFEGGDNPASMVTATGFNQIVNEEDTSIPSLGIGIFDDVSPFHQQPLVAEPLQQFQDQLLIKSEESHAHVLDPPRQQQSSEDQLAHQQPPLK